MSGESKEAKAAKAKAEKAEKAKVKAAKAKAEKAEKAKVKAAKAKAAKAEKAAKVKAEKAAEAKAKAEAKAAKAAAEESGVELQLVEVVELFTVHPGVLMSGLSDDQFRRRKHRLILVDGEKKHSDQSVYNAEGGIQFKVGERLMLECGPIHKTQLAKLDMVG